MSNPFDLNDDAAYQRWRAQKLASASRTLEDIIVEVGDLRTLTSSEHAALSERRRQQWQQPPDGPRTGLPAVVR